MNPTIVCVDDDADVLASLSEQLRRGLGRAVQVETACSGAEALELLDELADERADVPLLISDQSMPSMRGSELLWRAHDRYPAMLKILLTGQLDADAVGLAVNRANLYRVLAKPWQQDDLLLTVNEALRRVEQERALAERGAALERSMALLNATLDATHDGILVLDAQLRPSLINRRMADLWSIPAGVGAEPPAALLEHLRAQLAAPEAFALEPAQPIVLELRDGRAIEVSCRPRRLGSEDIGSVYSFRDVTERQRHSAELLHHARHDGLTGLPNRKSFDHELALALATADRLAVLFVDLDDFKRVNDTLGHACGDELLGVAARRLARALRERDLLARWGGDEFVVLLREVHGGDEAIAIARRLHAALAGRVDIAGHALQLRASVGVAVYPDDGADAAALLGRADAELYRVKSGSRNGVSASSAAASSLRS